MTRILVFVVLGMVLSCQSVPPETPSAKLPSADGDNGKIDLPNGFGAIVVADDLGRARHIAVDAEGDVYVKLRSLTDDGHGILALRDTTGNGRIDIQQGFGNYSGTGMALHNGYLYASSDSSVHRYKLGAGELKPSGEQEDIAFFEPQGTHASKPLAFDDAGNMYVTIGAPSNACQQKARTAGSPGLDPCPQLELHAGIWKFSASQTGQTHGKDGTRYATGIRNAMGLDWNVQQNSLFALQHGRDQLSGLFGDKFTDEQNAELPSEEFLQIDEGDDFGWPYCYYDHFQNKKILAPEYGGDGETQGRCESIKSPILAFPAHMAPNDLLFYTGDQFPEKYKNGAFIAFHGSWNRAPLPQKGYFVAFVPMKDGQPSGDWEEFATGFPQMEVVKNPRESVFRPVGLAQGPDGSLYISDSQKGRIWRVVYYGGNMATTETKTDESAEVSGKEDLSTTEIMAEGEAVYNTYCLACHQEDGYGVPSLNPPLAGTDWVTGDKSRLINVILNGMSDPVEINGETYSNVMASHAHLSDAEIAAVLTFVRASFGNEAGAVSPEEVKTVRAKNEG